MCYTVNVARKKAPRNKLQNHSLLTERLSIMCESILNFQGETQTFKAYIDPIDSFTADSLAETLSEKARTISIACGEGDTEATLYFFDEDQHAIEVEDKDGNISTVTATVDLNHLEYDDKLILQRLARATCWVNRYPSSRALTLLMFPLRRLCLTSLESS